MTSNYIEKEFQEDMSRYISIEKLIEIKIDQSDNDSLIRLDQMLIEQRYKTVFKIITNCFPILLNEEKYFTFRSENSMRINMRYIKLKCLKSNIIVMVFRHKYSYMTYNFYYEMTNIGKLTYYLECDDKIYNDKIQIISIEEFTN